MVAEKTENELVYDPVEKKEVTKYPRAVFIIILNEFCERFSYSGMRAFLTLYLKQKLFYSDDEATEVYHIFTTMAYFFAIIGAVMADSFFGKFRTILYLMIVYAVGNMILAITAIPTTGIPGREFTMLGLIMIALGTGGIKPCVTAFGGDQFVLPEQAKQLTTFFSIIYFVLNIASFVSKSVSPLLRSEVQCFGEKDCFSLAFGAPGVLIIISLVMFVSCKKMYIMKNPTGNVIADVCKCIYKSLTSRSALIKEGKKYDHWLDYARGSYDQQFINSVKKAFRAFLLFTPLPVFWSLLDQLGSRWTLQATKMDGRFWFFTMRPDQMQVTSPITVLILIPVFNKILYPFLAKYGILTKLLHRLLAGCLLAAVSYVFTGFLELKLEKTYPVLPSDGFGQLRMFNGHNCEMQFSNKLTGNNFTVNPLDFYENKFMQVEGNLSILYETTLLCPEYNRTWVEKIHIEENKAISYFYRDTNDVNNSSAVQYEDHVAKSRSGLPFVRILSNIINATDLEIWLKNTRKGNIEFWTDSTFTKPTEVFAGNYQLFINSNLAPLDVNLEIGGIYTIIINKDEESGLNARLVTVTQPNSISMAWIFPQVFIISIGEVLFVVSGLEFAFKEAPESMKAVLQAYWLLTEAFGNIIIIIVTRLGSGYRQVTQFFFFAALMLMATIVFYLLMIRYERHKEITDDCDQTKTPNERIVLSNKYIEIMQMDDTINNQDNTKTFTNP